VSSLTLSGLSVKVPSRRPARYGFAIWIVAAVALLAGCDQGPSAPQVANIVVDGPAAGIAVGATATFSASARDASGGVIPGIPFVWSSSAPTVAEVDPSSGLVTARGTGAVTIRATAQGVTGSRQLQVIPPPVAQVEVTPTTLTLPRGSETTLAVTLRDDRGETLFGRGLTFTSSSPIIASVTSDGRVRGLRVGTATITVVSESRQASALITVIPGDEPQVMSVTGAPMREGETVQINGTRFSPIPAQNIVRFEGVQGTVLAADPGFLQVRLPSFICAPEGPIEVTVEVASLDSDPFPALFQPSGVLDLAVGQFGYIPGGSPLCLRLAAGAGSPRYLVGIQSVSPTATRVDAVTVTGRAGGEAAGVAVAGAVAGALGEAVASAPSALISSALLRSSSGLGRFSIAPLGGEVALGPTDREARWTAHQRAHVELREDEPLFTPTIRAGAAALRLRSEVEEDPRLALASGLRSSGGPAAVSAAAQVGDTVRLNVPDLRTNFCATGIPITARVRARGTGSIWVEDIRNPPGGFTDENYQALAARFDDRILSVNTAYFGTPTDLDQNGRIVVVISQEVNRITSALGFVVTTDFFPKAGTPNGSCPASNEGEYYYAKAPDPNASIPAPAGETARAYTVADALSDAPILLAHETTHIIQLGRRLTSPTALELQTIWELEGQATFAEEVVGLADRNLALGGNYGFNVAWNSSGAADVNWFRFWVTDLAFYFGFRDQNQRNALAPGACGWLGRDDPPGSLAADCAPAGETSYRRLIYGVPYSFMRWLSDHFGDRFPGGEAEFHRRLVDAPVAGFPAFAQVLGEPVEPLLARWAAALYTDDRLPAGADPTLSFKTWNFRNIFEQGGLFPTVRLVPRSQGFSAFQFSQPIRSASSVYMLLESGNAPTHPPFSVRATGDGVSPLPSHLQMWVVRLQ